MDDEPSVKAKRLELEVGDTSVEAKLLSTLVGKPSLSAVVVITRLGLDEPEPVEARDTTEIKLLNTVIDKL